MSRNFSYGKNIKIPEKRSMKNHHKTIEEPEPELQPIISPKYYKDGTLFVETDDYKDFEREYLNIAKRDKIQMSKDKLIPQIRELWRYSDENPINQNNENDIESNFISNKDVDNLKYRDLKNISKSKGNKTGSEKKNKKLMNALAAYEEY